MFVSRTHERASNEADASPQPASAKGGTHGSGSYTNNSEAACHSVGSVERSPSVISFRNSL